MSSIIRVQHEDFDLAELYADLRQALGSDLGAVAAFVGLVRERNNKAGSGAQVQTLTLEHYPGMTEKSMQAIVDKALARWPIDHLTLVHRVGQMRPTEQIVAVLCGSAHRDAAFAAAEFVMDYLKTDAVFWKREATQQGEQWIESTASDHDRMEQWSADERT